MSEREHIALNNYFGNKQNPREQLKQVYETVKGVLSAGVRKELYTILYEADDEMFYIPELLKGKEKEKRYEESDDKRKCRYGLTVEGCRSCLFETLCHLEKDKSLVNKNK